MISCSKVKKSLFVDVGWEAEFNGAIDSDANNEFDDSCIAIFVSSSFLNTLIFTYPTASLPSLDHGCSSTLILFLSRQPSPRSSASLAPILLLPEPHTGSNNEDLQSENIIRE